MSLDLGTIAKEKFKLDTLVHSGDTMEINLNCWIICGIAS